MAKDKPIRCLICETILGELPASAGKGQYHCDKCNTTWDTVGGKLIEVTEKGEEIVIAKVQDAQEVVEDEPRTYDVYFVSKDKRRHQGVVKLSHSMGWMVLTTKQGKEILINAENVNEVEEV